MLAGREGETNQHDEMLYDCTFRCIVQPSLLFASDVTRGPPLAAVFDGLMAKGVGMTESRVMLYASRR